MSTPLLPCPFCGSSASLRPYSPAEDGHLPDVGEMILCDARNGGCGAHGPGSLYVDPSETAESLWNARSSAADTGKV